MEGHSESMAPKRTGSANDGGSRGRGKQKRRIASLRATEDSDEDILNDAASIGSSDAGDAENEQTTVSVVPARSVVVASGGHESDGSDDSNDGALDFTQPEYALQLSASQTPASQENESSRSKPPNIPSKVGQLSAKAIEDMTAQLVRYMLYKAGLKLPIRFADISKEVFPKHKNVSRWFFQKAKKQLENVFGYQVVAVDPSSSKELYLIVNTMASQEHLQLMNKTNQSASRGFLMMVLGLLWCAPARQLSENDLWKQLALLDSSITPSKDHRQLGDVAQLLKTFESQLYLASVSELDADLKKVKFFAYGPRTLMEVGNVQILNFVCKLVTGRPPSEVQIAELGVEAS